MILNCRDNCWANLWDQKRPNCGGNYCKEVPHAALTLCISHLCVYGCACLIVVCALMTAVCILFYGFVGGLYYEC